MVKIQCKCGGRKVWTGSKWVCFYCGAGNDEKENKEGEDKSNVNK